MKDYTETIMEEIRLNREYLGITQAELAEMSGLHRHIIQKIEAGSRVPTVNEFMALDRVFDGNIYWRLTEL